MKKAIVKTTYKQLVDDIGRLYEGARKALVDAYWKIGRRIVEVEQDGDIKSQYGSSLLESLSADLIKKYGQGFSQANLSRMRKFYLTHRILSAPKELNWTQYVELLPVLDKKLRKQLENRAVKEHLTSKDLRLIVQKRLGRKSSLKFRLPKKYESTSPLKCPSDLTLGTYKKVEMPQFVLPAGKVLVNCGFYVYHQVSDKAKINFAGKLSYTYPARVHHVVDGDTIVALIEVGFGTVVRESLRLRGIDTSELGDPEGDAVKKYVSSLLPKGKRIVIKSYRNDIYGRFVADVFYKKDSNSARDIVETGVFLNKQLLDEGKAEEWS